MNARNVLAVFAKELKDAIRDRRTLFSTLIIPTFVIPLLSFGTLGLGSKMVAKARDQKPVVMVIGGEDAPQVAARHTLRRVRATDCHADSARFPDRVPVWTIATA